MLWFTKKEPIKCGMNVPCPGINEESRLLAKRLMWVDMIREITRNLIGLMMVPGIVYLMYKFVEMAQPDEKMQVMMLVIGYLGGLATGVCTWYFGGAMRSAVQQAIDQARGGKPDVPAHPEPEPPPVVPATEPPAVALTDELRRKTDDARGNDPSTPVG
jgi:hypothetical protein